MENTVSIIKPQYQPVANIYCLSGTYGGFGGPNNMYLLFEPNKYNSNIIKIHTSPDLNLCVEETINEITKFNKIYNLPIILVGWSQGGYTIIKTVEKLAKTEFYKKIKSLIIISSRPEDTDYVSQMNGIKKFIICGEHDTHRRHNGSIIMYNNSAEPKFYKLIKNGTHNFESDELKMELFDIVNKILFNETSRFV